jgi:D-alanyl-D-alanine carboxypeptidase
MAFPRPCHRPRRRVCAAVIALLAALAQATGARAEGKGALLVVDANSGRVLQESAADEPRHPASLAKLMTLYIAFERIEQGRLHYQSKIRMSANAVAAAPSKLGLDEGEEIALIDAIKVLITKSANDVAIAIAETIAGSEEKFAALMNEKARQLGMRATVFRNASGLPDDAQVTTARDMITLALHLGDDFPKHYGLFATRTFTYGDETFRNHNTLLFHYEGTDGLKTGYTRASGFNLVASVRRGRKHVIGVIFGGDSAASRNWAMRTYLNLALTQASSVRTRTPAPLKIARAGLTLRRSPETAPRRLAPPAVAAAAAEPTPPLPPPTSAPTPPPPIPARASPPPEGIAVTRVRQVLVGEPIRAAPGPTAPEEPAEHPDGIEALLASHPNAREEEGAETRAEAGIARWARALGPAPAGAAALPAVTGPPPDPAEGRDAAPPPPAAPPKELADAPPGPPPVPSGPAAVAGAETKAASWEPLAIPSPTELPSQSPSPSPLVGGFQIQIGAYASEAEAQRQLTLAKERAPGVLDNRAPLTVQVKQGDKLFFRARYSGFAAQTGAALACTELKRLKFDCLVMKAQ